MITAMGYAIGVLGVAATIYFALRAEAANRARRRLTWTDLQAAATDLARRIKRDCDPVAIVTPGLPGATFANLLANEFSGQPPVYVGVETWREDPAQPVLSEDSFVIETNKWTVTIPNAPGRYEKGVILIVDDFAMSGDFLERLSRALQAAGVEANRIRSATIAATNVAIANHKAPDYFWWTADDDNFYFPWGKAR